MTTTDVSTVLDKLFACEIAVRPHWYQPGAPRECWLFVARDTAWLIVWDPSVRRVESATRYAESALRERLPELAGASVFDHTIVAYTAVDAALAALAESFVTRRDEVMKTLQNDRRSSMRAPLSGRASSRLLFSAAVGWKDVNVSPDGAVTRHAPIGEEHARSLVEAALFSQGAVEVEPVSDALLDALERGEQRYLALCQQMRAGTLGWGVHVALTVIEVDGQHYNTAFSGETATSFTVFRPQYLLADMLTRATASGDLPAPARALTAAQFDSARTLVAKQNLSPAQLVEKMLQGALSIAGGGPTSEDVWSLDFVRDHFEWRSALGEVREMTGDEVLALFARRGFTTMHWR